MASVLSVSVLGSIALAQVLPCLVQLSLVMLVLYVKRLYVECSEDQSSILPPRLSLGLILLAPMSKRPLAQAQGLLQGGDLKHKDRIEGDFPTLRLRRRFVQVASIC